MTPDATDRSATHRERAAIRVLSRTARMQIRSRATLCGLVLLVVLAWTVAVYHAASEDPPDHRPAATSASCIWNLPGSAPPPADARSAGVIRVLEDSHPLICRSLVRADQSRPSKRDLVRRALLRGFHPPVPIHVALPILADPAQPGQIEVPEEREWVSWHGGRAPPASSDEAEPPSLALPSPRPPQPASCDAPAPLFHFAKAVSPLTCLSNRFQEI